MRLVPRPEPTELARVAAAVACAQAPDGESNHAASHAAATIEPTLPPLLPVPPRIPYAAVPDLIPHRESAHKRLRFAVETLATHPGPLCQRLELALLTLRPVDQKRIRSRAVRQRFEQLLAEANGATYELGEQRSSALAARILSLAMSMRDERAPSG